MRAMLEPLSPPFWCNPTAANTTSAKKTKQNAHFLFDESAVTVEELFLEALWTLIASDN